VSQTSLPHGGSAKPLAGSYQRATVRYRCAPATIGKVFINDDHEYQPAWVSNLSLGGVGLQIQRPVDLGTMILVQIRSPLTNQMHKLPAQVAHCFQVPQGEWYLGCEFIAAISHELLDELLG
jgi:hypothetical protein